MLAKILPGGRQIINIALRRKYHKLFTFEHMERLPQIDTSLATGIRPSTVVTTDQTRVDIFRTTVSEAPAKTQNEELST